MSGHSKWSQIKHKKAATDAKRGNLFTKLSRDITVAAKQGGGHPDTNNRLRLAVDRARTYNMPKDNIDRAIKKGTGELEGVEYTEATYGGYGPGGSAFLIEVVTDNINRTVADLRKELDAHGGKMADSASVAYQFGRKVAITATTTDPEALELAAIDTGAEDTDVSDQTVTAFCDPKISSKMEAALRDAGGQNIQSSMEMVSSTPVTLRGADETSAQALFEALAELDDVSNVHTNIS